MAKVEIIATGSELVQGAVKNTTTPFIIDQLMAYGYEITRLNTVRDNLEEIKGALCEALTRADLIIITGGLGPTPDDVTRDAIAESIQMPLEFRGELWEEIQSFFKQRGRETPPPNINQAYLPYGALAIPNTLGTAAGIIVNYNSKIIVALPGPPEELQKMFLDEVKSIILQNFTPQNPFLTRCFKIYGIGETAVLQRLKDVQVEARSTSAMFSYLPRGGEVHLVLRVASGEPLVYSELEKKIRLLLGEDLYGIDDETLPGKVGELLRRNNLSISVAESCTGGLVLNYLTDIPGSSDYLRGGIVAYNNTVKEKQLGVRGETLATYSEVSANTAMEMAIGIRKILDTDIGLAITGFAGPTGGFPGTPVGTVYVGLSTPQENSSTKLFYPGLGRRTVKTMAAKAALDFLRRYLLRLGG